MKRSFDHTDLARFIQCLGRYRTFSAYHVMAKTGASKEEVVRAIQTLRVMPGWSIVRRNRWPDNVGYGGRRRRSPRWFNHRYVNPDEWLPTAYVVLKTPEDTHDQR